MAITSPFPGMDPYLEWHWGDVHTSLITYIRDAIQDKLPGDLRARVEERVYLESEIDGPMPNTYVPDVRVIQEYQPRAASSAQLDNGGVAVTPLVVEYDHEPFAETYIEIRDGRSGGRVVTLIEVVSPGNKAGGEGEKKYTTKQEEILAARGNLVEIDLTRGGHHVLAAPWRALARKHKSPYRVCVTRGDRPGRSEWYPIRLPDPLPSIAVPLRATDADVVLDLQPVFQQAYRNGRYDDIDYAKPPVPSLDPEDAAWADGLLKSKGLR